MEHLAPAIEINGLRKSFGNRIVLDGIDLAVQPGTVFGLLGPNGAGKTTLIHIMSTLVKPDGGTVRIAGHDVVAEKNAVKRSIGLTGQFAAVDEILTAEENLRMMGRLSGLTPAEARRRAGELLAAFDLEDAARRKVKTYSGGMRRRLDLAVSLVVSRPILFLDEPTTGLDTRSRRALWDIIAGLAKRGGTIFLTTQYLEEADQLADFIAVIGGGRVIASGTAKELKSLVGGEMLELYDANDELLGKIPTAGHIRDIQQKLGEIAHLYPQDTRVVVSRPTMDDVFLALTSTDKEAMPV